MKSFRKFALLSTIGTYMVIFMGGLVRVSGAGLGCPDWPQCFGRWFPPTSAAQLPPDIDPSRFNFTLAWIEYINRLCGMFLGLLILTTALIAIFKHRDKPKILYPSMFAAMLVALIGLQGRFVITTELQPMVVTVHMLLSLVLASVLIYTTLQAYIIEKPSAVPIVALDKRNKYWVTGLWLLAIVQVVLGTQIRSKLELLADQFPLLTDVEWLTRVGALNHIHLTLGLLVAILTWLVGRKFAIASTEQGGIIKTVSAVLMILIGVQVILGITFMSLSMPEVARLLHLWVASFYIGLLFLLYLSLRESK